MCCVLDSRLREPYVRELRPDPANLGSHFNGGAMPILLCHVVWMPRYAGEDEVRPGGFDFVQEEGFGHELFNFLPVRGTCYGYVQTNGRINIDRLGASRDDTLLDGVTVIWTATHPQGGRVVVGWYKDARVYRNHQQGRLAARSVNGERIGFKMQADSENCFLVPASDRNFMLPRPERGERGLPGENPVFYPEDSRNRRLIRWLTEVKEYMTKWAEEPIEQGSNLGRSGRWSTRPDVAHNAAVEDAAIACVIKYFGAPANDRQKDNCGWDLEFDSSAGKICVEVKGLSGTDIAVEVTPNEYSAMKRAMIGEFTDGAYKLAVVLNALTNPSLFLFTHESDGKWVCERTGRRIATTERIAARLQE